jgi:hypothetical protein
MDKEQIIQFIRKEIQRLSNETVTENKPAESDKKYLREPQINTSPNRPVYQLPVFQDEEDIDTHIFRVGKKKDEL